MTFGLERASGEQTKKYIARSKRIETFNRLREADYTSNPSLRTAREAQAKKRWPIGISNDDCKGVRFDKFRCTFSVKSIRKIQRAHFMLFPFDVPWHFLWSSACTTRASTLMMSEWEVLFSGALQMSSTHDVSPLTMASCVANLSYSINIYTLLPVNITVETRALCFLCSCMFHAVLLMRRVFLFCVFVELRFDILLQRDNFIWR